MNCEYIEIEFMKYINEIANIDKVHYVFSGKVAFQDFIFQVVFEVLKDEFYAKDSVKSLNQWLCDSDSHLEYQSYKRIMKYVRYYKENLRLELTSKLSSDSIEQLNLINMEFVENRLKGYNLNSFKFIQLVNIQRYQLLKCIIDKRICSSKKISNSKFIDFHNELEKYYFDLKCDGVDYEDIFKNMIHLYEIEKSYSTEVIYKIASIICEKNVNLDDEILERLGFIFNFVIPIANGKYSCENRFLAHRHYFIEELIAPHLNEQSISVELEKFLNILYLKSMLTKNLNLREFIIYYDRNEMLKMIIDHYQLFSIIEEKKWDNKKIRVARNLYKGLFKNIKSPVIRT